MLIIYYGYPSLNPKLHSMCENIYVIYGNPDMKPNCGSIMKPFIIIVRLYVIIGVWKSRKYRIQPLIFVVYIQDPLMWLEINGFWRSWFELWTLSVHWTKTNAEKNSTFVAEFGIIGSWKYCNANPLYEIYARDSSFVFHHQSYLTSTFEYPVQWQR